jgi:hypothetical protein
MVRKEFNRVIRESGIKKAVKSYAINNTHCPAQGDSLRYSSIAFQDGNNHPKAFLCLKEEIISVFIQKSKLNSRNRLLFQTRKIVMD